MRDEILDNWLDRIDEDAAGWNGMMNDPIRTAIHARVDQLVAEEREAGEQFAADWLAFMESAPAIIGDKFYTQQQAKRSEVKAELLARAKVLANSRTPSPETAGGTE